MLIKGIIINKRYKTLERLGVGGMGAVWKCEDIVLKRVVALKFINEAYSINNPECIKILEDEAKLGAKLIGHPNIVTILDYGVYSNSSTQASFYYIAMECVEGVNLYQWINDYIKKIDPVTAYNINLFIAWEICKGISYAHSKGVLHRDIKPLNIFLSNMGITKVGDFGISRSIDAATRTHTVWKSNTPAYCSPEQWKGEKPTNKTEVYQIACTFYELFTGKLPYDASNLMSLMNAHMHEEPVKPNEINPTISKELSDSIVKALAKNGKDRVVLWELFDTIAKEIQGVYEMQLDVHNDPPNIHELVNDITEFRISELKEDVFNFDFPDFTEALSESLQLVMAGITNITVNKAVDESLQEAATTSQ